MAFKPIFAIGILLLACADRSVAQDSAYQWSLQACIDYALKHNYEVNTLRLAKATSEQNYLQAKAAILPGVSGSVSQYFNHGNNVDPIVGGFQSQSSFSGNYGINGSWILYNGGYLRSDIRQKNLLVQSAGLNILQQQNDLTLQVTQTYLNILIAKENVVYEKDLLETSKAQVNQGQQLFDAGSIAKKDLIDLEAQAATDQYNVVTWQNNVLQNTLTLKQLLLLPSDSSLDITEPDTSIIRQDIVPLQITKDSALANRPEIRNGEIGQLVAREDLNKARAGYWPTLSMGAQIATGYSSSQSDPWLQQLDDNFYQQVGLSLSIPIFTKRVNRSNVERAKIEMSQADLNLQNTRTLLEQQVEQAYINVQTARAQYEAAAEQVKATQESYRIANEQLKAGALNAVDLLVQKNLYVQALQNYIQAKYSTAMYIKIYDFYRGIPIK